MALSISFSSWFIPQEGLSCILVSFYWGGGVACLSSMLLFSIPLGGKVRADFKILYLFLSMCISLFKLFFHMYGVLPACVYALTACIVLNESRRGHLLLWNYRDRWL